MKYILLFIFVALLFGCNSENNSVTSKVPNEIQKKLSEKEIITELEKLDFFNLTEPSEMKKVKAGFEKSYTDLNFFQGPMRGETMNFMDNRFHWVDCEELFEMDGLTEYLTQVKSTFEKLGLQLEFAKEKSEQNETNWRHTIELNGIEYMAFDGQFSDLDWGVAYVNFLEMLNAELRRQKSDEQFYPISCGNDGMFVLLTPIQLDFVNRNYPMDNEHPTTISNWKSKNGM